MDARRPRKATPLSSVLIDRTQRKPTVYKPLEWMKDALCANPTVDPELFFPPRGGSGEYARLICAECPVRTECLAYALEFGGMDGIWGGTSLMERYEIRRRRRVA